MSEPLADSISQPLSDAELQKGTLAVRVLALGQDQEQEKSAEHKSDADAVETRAANLASRQASAAPFRPRPQHREDDVLPTTAPTDRDIPSEETPQHDDGLPVSETSAIQGAAPSSQHSSPTFLRRHIRSSDRSVSNGPQIDEDAIHAVTDASSVDHEGHFLREAQSDGQTSAISSSSSPSRSPQRSLQRSGTTTSLKRMTVVLDEEEPDGQDEETSHSDDRSDYLDSIENDAVNQHNSHDQPAEPIEELDADITNEYGSISDAAGTGTDRIEPQRLVNMSASLARLRGEQPRSESEEHIAHGERQRDEFYISSRREGNELSDEEEEEDDDFEEDEPTLKYSRLHGSVPDILKKDTASALAASDRFLALGTHGGAVYILDEQGNLTKGFRTHTASILDLVIDSTAEFVGSAGMDGLVSVASLSSSETYTFDFKRVMRTVSLEPGFGRRSTRSFVCGGMAGQLVLREKSWFGHRESILHEGEGPIWTTQWRGNLIAWANDRGVRIYDVASRHRVAFISPPDDLPRADFFRCTLLWQDDVTLLIAWADCIKVAKVRQRTDSNKMAGAVMPTSSGRPTIEVTAILQLDCMISGIAPRGADFLVLAYLTEDDDHDSSSVMEERESHRRREGLRPELRLISNDGEELSSDVLSLQSFARFQCNDYLLVPSTDALASGAAAISQQSRDKKAIPVSAEQSINDYFYVVSPKDIVVARSRDEKDHIDWLLQHRLYQEAITAIEDMGREKALSLGFDIEAIGEKYLAFLIHEKQDWQEAADVAPGILKGNNAAWETFALAAADQKALQYVIHSIPTHDPTLGVVVYDMILIHFLRYDVPLLLATINTWPSDIYSTQAVVLALEDRLSRSEEQQKGPGTNEKGVPKDRQRIQNATDRSIMECLAEVFVRNRQPGRALPYFLRLRKPGVFALIREHNLFTVIQDQAFLLVEFEQDLLNKSEKAGKHDPVQSQSWQSIQLLVDHTHSIPIHRVVPQLQERPFFLYLYLDALFVRDPQLVAAFSDMQVELYAEFDYAKLMGYLRTMSSYYSFEKAYNVCKARDYVIEMVFLLSRIGDSKTALMLIIERLGDVERAISFVKEEKDPELWDNLVHYSEDKPNFIRGLLENVGGEVDASKLIRRIKNGLEIEGLRDALIKILSDFSLQISLLEGCAGILAHDGRAYAQALDRGQTEGMYCDADTVCSTCGKPLLATYKSGMHHINKPNPSNSPASVGAQKVPDSQHQPQFSNEVDALPANAIVFLCRHTHHLTCLVANVASIPKRSGKDEQELTGDDALVVNMTTTRALATGQLHAAGAYGPQVRAAQCRRHLQSKLRYLARLRVVLKRGCPVCQAEREEFRI